MDSDQGWNLYPAEQYWQGEELKVDKNYPFLTKEGTNGSPTLFNFAELIS